MKAILKIYGVIIILVFLHNHSFGKNLQTYKHPSLNIQFQAPADWKQLPRPEDKLIYEVCNIDTTIHVVLWYTETEQDGSAYLWKMASMKDLVVAEKPVHRLINKRDAWVLHVPGYENKIKIRMLLAVIPHGKSPIRPKENALFIIQIWCPDENYEQHKQTIENIIESIEVID
jgi:hypothetical protein